MARNKFIISEDIEYISKEHFCPHCQSKLKVVSTSKILDAKSPEAKRYNDILAKSFHRGRSGSIVFVGETEYVVSELKCENCDITLSVNEMKKTEGVISDSSDNVLSTDDHNKKKLPSYVKHIIFIVVGVLIVLVVKYIAEK